MKYRISKYDPQYRDSNDVYTKEEWTDFSDIGKVFENKEFLYSEYRMVELKLILVIVNILIEKNINLLVIDSVERRAKFRVTILHVLKKASLKEKVYFNLMKYKKGHIISIAEMFLFCQLILRNCIWCSFKGISQLDTVVIECGWDYYVHIDCDTISNETIEYANRMGIYIEKID